MEQNTDDENKWNYIGDEFSAACRKGDVQKVSKMINNININKKPPYFGWTFLNYAEFWGKDELRNKTKTVEIIKEIEKKIEMKMGGRMIREEEKRVLDDKKRKWMRSKLLVVGDERVGKSSAINWLIKGKEGFDPHIESTEGADISTTNADVNNWRQIKDDKITFKCQAFDEINQRMKRTIDGDDNNAKEDVIQPYGNSKMTEKVSNRGDNARPHKGVLNELSEAFIDHISRLSLDESDDEEDIPLVLNIWDFGGQRIFHHMQQFLRTDRGVYILVFDASKDIDPMAVKYWMMLHPPSAPLMVVGTHSDVDKGLCEANFSKLRDCVTVFKGKMSCSVKFQLISCKEDDGLKEFREVLVELSNQCAHITTECPMSWRLLEYWLFRMKEKYEYLTWHQVRYLASNKAGIDGELPLVEALKHLSDMGSIVFHQLMADCRNNDWLVFLKPEWVVDALKAVITEESILQDHFNGAPSTAMLSDQDWKQCQLGLFTGNFLNYLWRKFEKNELDILRKLLIHLNLAIDVCDDLLITCMVPKDRLHSSWKFECHDMVCLLRFEFLPHSTFHRILTLFMKHPNHQRISLHQNSATFALQSGNRQGAQLGNAIDKLKNAFFYFQNTFEGITLTVRCQPPCTPLSVLDHVVSLFPQLIGIDKDLSDNFQIAFRHSCNQWIDVADVKLGLCSWKKDVNCNGCLLFNPFKDEKMAWMNGIQSKDSTPELSGTFSFASTRFEQERQLLAALAENHALKRILLDRFRAVCDCIKSKTFCLDDVFFRIYHDFSASPIFVLFESAHQENVLPLVAESISSVCNEAVGIIKNHPSSILFGFSDK